MFLIDTVTAANGGMRIRKRRACPKCHRVRIVFRPNARTCEDCREDCRFPIALYDSIAAMRLERAQQRHTG